MLSVREATVFDLLNMQQTNLWCLPENYLIPYNREVEEMLRAAFDDVQQVRTLGCGKGEGWTPLPVNMPIPRTHM